MAFNAPPVPQAPNFFLKYKTQSKTNEVYLYACLCPYLAHGEITEFTKGNNECFSWFMFWWACGGCMIEEQRKSLETKIHNWHASQGDPLASKTAPDVAAHNNLGAILCCAAMLYGSGLICWGCAIAENLGVKRNFEQVQVHSQVGLTHVHQQTVPPVQQQMLQQQFQQHQRYMQEQQAQQMKQKNVQLTINPLADVSTSSERKKEGYDIFMSYRRSHTGVAKSIKYELQSFGYRVFLDIEREDGLGAGDFQNQLEKVADATPVFVVLVTPRPSGDDDVRFPLSSFETIVEYNRRGWTDYCQIEISRALAANKLVIPVYNGSQGTSFIGQQLGLLRGLDDVAGLASKNAYPYHEDLFKASIQVIHNAIVESGAVKF
ncbi:hypothetical protein CYMTET_38650 [Cymbomonas tetramitiformis]|uniref:TIR domain-containing protein n=1 Tax=Cymbomonas tetramitiformis TaxID=36881 RepID=A0AAE0CBQ3_9CHLO|nr:hypothetical protein CYMTET_38650 [Cymbomonas tetramitiformis]|eukprot:gene22782-27504_t